MNRDVIGGTIAAIVPIGLQRVGIRVDGAGSSATVRGNEVVGIGEKSAGRAGNGKKASRGAPHP